MFCRIQATVSIVLNLLGRNRFIPDPHFRDRAFEILESIPANKEDKQSLQNLVNFVIDRNV
jgi:hypothetical protein